jgi:hypothetical protein
MMLILKRFISDSNPSWVENVNETGKLFFQEEARPWGRRGVTASWSSRWTQGSSAQAPPPVFSIWFCEELSALVSLLIRSAAGPIVLASSATSTKGLGLNMYSVFYWYFGFVFRGKSRRVGTRKEEPHDGCEAPRRTDGRKPWAIHSLNMTYHMLGTLLPPH